ncbi:hypothetical protein [uncultured Sutterella sp.]|uniref:hypothetical protein n=1 Tax=uncultured Sutterella sp. TaxID=286133 RepID=UPI00280BC1B7|nr:hypothetical protein [uncultured Sutterella sp.]
MILKKVKAAPEATAFIRNVLAYRFGAPKHQQLPVLSYLQVPVCRESGRVICKRHNSPAPIGIAFDLACLKLLLHVIKKPFHNILKLIRLFFFGLFEFLKALHGLLGRVFR